LAHTVCIGHNVIFVGGVVDLWGSLVPVGDLNVVYGHGLRVDLVVSGLVLQHCDVG